MSTFLITGATGFIGTHLCHRLTADGHKVVALVRNKKKAKALPQNNIEYLEGDLSLFKKENLKLPKVDYVLHIAGIIAGSSPDEYLAINTQSTIDLVTCLEKQNWKPKRFLLASSLAAAGPTTKQNPKNEQSPCSPIEPYGVSKLKAEEYLFQNASFPITSFRPGLVMGPGDPAVLTLFKMAKMGFGFKVMGMDQEISFIYVNDLIEAIVAICFDTSEKHKKYFTVHNKIIKISQLWESLKKASSKKVFVLPVPRPLLFGLMMASTFLSKIFSYTNQLDIKQYTQIITPAYTCTSKALMDDFNWEAKYDLEKAVLETYKGYEEMGWL